MTRNAVIADLPRAVLVVEVRERGGTLNAGLQALDIGRPMYATAYADNPPAGNQILFERGARPVAKPERAPRRACRARGGGRGRAARDR
jgi:DNA processing protein